jgi:hypothetical protein
MTKNLYHLWWALLLISGGIALWFSGNALLGFWKFIQLDTQTSAQIFQWEIRDLSSSRFAIEASYRYEVQGRTYKGKTMFESPLFLNRYAAENYLKTLEAKGWRTWYKKRSPAFSSLEKEFPQKKCVQALVTVGVFAYFYFARSMFSRLFLP